MARSSKAALNNGIGILVQKAPLTQTLRFANVYLAPMPSFPVHVISVQAKRSLLLAATVRSSLPVSKQRADMPYQGQRAHCIPVKMVSTV